MKKAESASELAASGQACIERYEMERGLELLGRALQLEPDSVPLLDAIGEACLQAGRRDEARLHFSRSVELQPHGAPGRYMYLGQLMEGIDAVRCFEQGVAILRVEREEVERRSGAREALRQAWVEATHALATGLCSAAEIYLTDACDEPDAEQRCEALAMEVRLE